MQKSKFWHRFAIISIFTPIKSLILDLLFPVSCIGCNRADYALCPSCLRALRFMPPACIACKKIVPARGRVPPGRTCRGCRAYTPVFAFCSPFSYRDSVVKRAIHIFKFRRLRMLCGHFGDVLVSYLHYYHIDFPKDSLLVPIPLHPRRLRRRGFNQSELVAGYLGEKLGLTVAGNVLKRITHTWPQTALTADERVENIAHSFAAPSPKLIEGKTVILLDDVKTTGATLNEAASVLKEAGAWRVWAITIAY